MIKCLLYRTYILSSPEFNAQNIDNIRKILIINNYTKNFINPCIKSSNRCVGVAGFEFAFCTYRIVAKHFSKLKDTTAKNKE